MKVYLAGAITGLSYDQATIWRYNAAYQLNSNDIETLDPMRGKYELRGELKIKNSYSGIDNCNPVEILMHDIADINECSTLLVNMEGITGIGTPFELGYAYCQGKTSVLFNVPERLKGHPFIYGNDLVTAVEDLDEAINKVFYLFWHGGLLYN